MAILLKGVPVADALKEKMAAETAALKEKGIEPTLAILRVGEKPADLSYEKGAVKCCESVGVCVRSVVLPRDVDSDSFFRTLEDLNLDPAVHGILMFRPLPAQLDSERARKSILPSKDVDGCTDGSLAGVFTGSGEGFAPCTAEAVMEILKFYDIDPAGKKVAVIGRSLVIGRPVAMLLLQANATVTICHTKTQNVAEITRQADMIVSAAGKLKSLSRDMVCEGQTVIDVSMNWDPEKLSSKGTKGAMAGDAVFADVEPVVGAITPVPGGVGAVTTAVMISHVVRAAQKNQ